VFGRIGLTEILIIMVILVFLFGARKIPELARGMGLGIKEFKKGLNEGDQAGTADESGEVKEVKEEQE
jgi:sec-independent protein translocase protein TatA